MTMAQPLFTLTAAGGGNYDNIEDGYYTAELVKITIPEEKTQVYDGKEKTFEQSRFIWRIVDGSEAEGQEITLFVNVSGRGEKSKMFEVLSALGLDPNQVFMPDDLTGRKAKLNIQVVEGKDGTRRSKIMSLKRVGAAAKPAPKGSLF